MVLQNRTTTIYPLPKSFVFLFALLEWNILFFRTFGSP